MQRADHFLAGFEVDLSKTISVNIEGYYKNFRQVTNINRNKLYNNTPEFADKPDALKKDFVVETGRRRRRHAAEVREGRAVRVGGLRPELCDALGWHTGVPPHLGPSPQREPGGELHLRQVQQLEGQRPLELRQRLPFTQTQGFYGQDPFGGGVGTDITQNNPDLSTVYGPLNGGELPYYGRLDLGLTKTWKLDDRQTVRKLDLSCTNTLDRQNIFYFDRVRYQRVNQLPLLPSIGFSYTF